MLTMPSPVEIKSLVDSLHTSKVINADTSAKNLVEQVSQGIVNPAVLAGWYVVGGDHYVIVCGAQQAGIAELGARNQAGG
jgi:hypothetical protein